MGSAQSPRRSRCAGLRADGVSGARQPLQEGVWVSTHEGQGSGKAGVGWSLGSTGPGLTGLKAGAPGGLSEGIIQPEMRSSAVGTTVPVWVCRCVPECVSTCTHTTLMV